MGDAGATRQTKRARTNEDKSSPRWDDIDAELSCSVREAGVGCGTIGTMTDSAMDRATANLREAVNRRRAS